MKEFIEAIREEPEYAHSLISKMLGAVRRNKDHISILGPLMTGRRHRWLQQKGFTMSFNTKTQEWKVKL